jgi:hypothetical protein
MPMLGTDLGPDAGAPTERRRQRRRARLTSDEILAAIRHWNDLYGEPPAMTDWDPYRARQTGQEWRIARYDAVDWPSIKSVRNHFGRLSDAVAAAGLVPRLQGQQRQHRQLALGEGVRLHLAHIRSIRSNQPPPEALAAALREVAQARRSDEQGDLESALVQVAAAALAWAASTP